MQRAESHGAACSAGDNSICFAAAVVKSTGKGYSGSIIEVDLA